MPVPQAEFAARREALLERIGEGVAVIPAAPVFIRNNDVEHAYRQDSDFYYLSGFDEPESVLVATNVHGEHRSVLFVRERNPEREVWDGPRAGVEGAVETYGVDAAFPIQELGERLPAYLIGARRLHCRVGYGAAFLEVLFRALSRARQQVRRSGEQTPTELVDIQTTIHEQRLLKSAVEVEAMAAAAAVTSAAHQRAMAVARPGMHEFEVEAEMQRIFRAAGCARTAYDSILGAGPNATILHYRANTRRIEEGELLLIDAGCELDYYASDVTRTFPVGGRFSDPQRRLYEWVLAAQEASIAAIRPGATLDDIHDASVRVLAEGMVKEGLLEGSVEEVIASGAYQQFYMHRTSHWIGMDVHDVGSYFQEGKARPLQEGMVLTVEPGFYVSANADVDSKWHNIGIRIEDDLLVTADGSRNLTADIPKSVADVEALTAS